MNPKTNTEPIRASYAVATAAERMWRPTASCFCFTTLTYGTCLAVFAFSSHYL